jgi:16S rRNA processing protein RimM
VTASGGSATTPSGTRPARLVVALVRGFRGLHGHVRVELLTDRPEDRFVAGAVLHPEGSEAAFTIVEAAPVADGPGWWLRFRELPSRETAETLRDQYLEIDAPAEEREPGRWFFHELVGLAVRSTSGEDLGTVSDVYRAGGAEVFLVRGPRGELDVPGVRGIVTELAPEKGEMIVDLDALDMDARPVEDEAYVRPRDRRPRKQPKPKGPAQPPKGTGPVRRPGPNPGPAKPGA